MLDLEWFRSFRAVYTTGSLTKAAKHLVVSQPTVSQHIQALESRVGKKLFIRKSKGVIPTDSGRLLSNMVASAIESLEAVEAAIVGQNSSLTSIISIGVSEHMYRSLLGEKFHKIGASVHVRFGDRQTLIDEVERGNLLYAILPEAVNTFDVICHHLFHQNLVLVGSPDIDFTKFELHFRKKDKKWAKEWLASNTWYSHNPGGDFIKHYWLNVFNKERPAIVPDYVIPNEFDTLKQQSTGSGLSVAFDTTVAPFVRRGELKLCHATKVKIRDIVLIANKKNTQDDKTIQLLNLLASENAE